MEKLLSGGDVMDKNLQNGLSGGYKIPSEQDIENNNQQKKMTNKANTTSSISESSVIKNNTVK